MKFGKVLAALRKQYFPDWRCIDYDAFKQHMNHLDSSEAKVTSFHMTLVQEIQQVDRDFQQRKAEFEHLQSGPGGRRGGVNSAQLRQFAVLNYLAVLKILQEHARMMEGTLEGNSGVAAETLASTKGQLFKASFFTALPPLLQDFGTSLFEASFLEGHQGSGPFDLEDGDPTRSAGPSQGLGRPTPGSNTWALCQGEQSLEQAILEIETVLGRPGDRDCPASRPDVSQPIGSLASPTKAGCDSNDEPVVDPERASGAVCSAQGSPRASSPGTPGASQPAWSTPPSTPRARPRVPTTPPPLRLREPIVEPLLLCLERNCLKQVRLAIEAHPEAAKEPFWESRFEWPLCAAVRLGCSEEVVRLLIENGAKVDMTSVDGLSPLQLLSSGKENHIFSAPPIDLRGMQGTAEWTEWVRKSTEQFELSVATALLNAGADPRACHGDPGRGHCSSLEFARRSGKDHLVSLYKTHGR